MIKRWAGLDNLFFFSNRDFNVGIKKHRGSLGQRSRAWVSCSPTCRVKCRLRSNAGGLIDTCKPDIPIAMNEMRDDIKGLNDWPMKERQSDTYLSHHIHIFIFLFSPSQKGKANARDWPHPVALVFADFIIQYLQLLALQILSFSHALPYPCPYTLFPYSCLLIFQSSRRHSFLLRIIFRNHFSLCQNILLCAIKMIISIIL